MTLLAKTKENTKFVNLDYLSYKDENELRNIFIDNMESILTDVETIEANSFIYVKELDNIDIVIIGNDGSIFLVETKLANNSDAKEVIAQILGYGAKFKKKPFKYFEKQWLILEHSKEKNLIEELNKHFENGNEVLNHLKENWEEGRFSLIIVMDHIHPDICSVAEFLKEKKLLIYGIELQKYLCDQIEVLSSKIFWEEFIQTSPSYLKQIPDDSEFLKSYSKIGLNRQIEDLTTFFNDLKEGRKTINGVEAYKTQKYFNFRISNGFASAALHVEPKYEGGGIQFGCKKVVEEKLLSILKEYNVVLLNPLKKEYGKIGKWDLEDFSKEKFEKILEDISSILIRG